MKKNGKSIKIVLGVVTVVLVLVFLFISQIAKYLIEKYDEKYTGRQITLDYAYVNPFTGYIYLDNLRVFEPDRKEVFLHILGVKADFALLKLFSNTYEISSLVLDQPVSLIKQRGKIVNFVDIIEKFSGDSSKTGNEKHLHFNLLNLKITDGKIVYQEEEIPVNFSIIKFNFESPGIRWDIDTIFAKYSFASGVGKGDINGDFTYNLKTEGYRLTTNVKQFDLNIIEQYLKDITNYGSFRAVLDAHVKAVGNLNDSRDISTNGGISVSDFHFGKSPTVDYASFSKLEFNMIKVSPKEELFNFDTISLVHPYFNYENYDSLDNLETIFGSGGSNIYTAKNDPQKFNLVIEIANYVKLLLQNFFQSNYNINRLVVSNGELKYNDFSLGEKFSTGLKNLSIISDSLSKSDKLVKVNLISGLEPYGQMAVDLRINPNDSGFFDLKYKVEKVPVSLFNPYLISYSSYPLDRGSLEMEGLWNVRDGKIQSSNHVVVIDPRVTKRLKNKNNSWIPMRIVMSFIRERGNVIDYSIPITGDLNSPNFNFRDIIFDTFKNIFIKPVTTAYRMEIKDIETEIEKSQKFKWEMCQNTISKRQEKFINKIVSFLKNDREASITISPYYYEVKEKEYILFFEAKKKYFYRDRKDKVLNISESDSIKIDKYSIKNPEFVKYLNNYLKDSLLFTIQEKCLEFLDSTEVNAKYNDLKKSREDAFAEYFNTEVLKKQLSFKKSVIGIPFDGFSLFKIEYNGEIPVALEKAYELLQEKNNSAPRNKFILERKQTGKNN